MRGIRGAITISKNTSEEILQASEKIVREMLVANHLDIDQIGACLFSATDDITEAFPAAGARRIEGFEFVPLFDARQMDVTNGLPLCIRVLMLVETSASSHEIHHVYLGEAKNLRRDLLED